MSTIKKLHRLTIAATQAPPTEDSLREAVEAIRHALGAHEVHLVFAEDDEFRWASAADHGVDALTSQVGLAIIQRSLVENGCPVGFDIRGRRVEDVVAADCGIKRPWLAIRLPTVGSASEMLLVRGRHRTCLPAKDSILLDTALPALSVLVSRVLDAERASRQRRELNVLSELAFTITQSRDMETVLTRLATTTAIVSEHDYAIIDILKAGSDRELLFRCLNESRFSGSSLVRIWKQWGLERGLDPMYRDVVLQRRPAVYTDLQNDERISDEMRAFFRQALLVSAVILPFVFRDEVLGTLSVASYRSRSYPSEEVSFLEGLAAQVTATIKAMQTFDELEESRRQLREYAERLQEAVEQQHHLARTDALTGIPNRRYVEEVLETACARARREDSALSVVLTDVDNFKHINDGYGHRAGDRALIRLAKLARRQCRRMDVVGRYGGDEFIFVLPLADLQQAVGFAQRLRSCVAGRLRPVGTDHRGRLTISLGVAQFRASDRSPDPLLQRADEALYRAKALGKDRVCAEEVGALAA